MLSSEDIRMRQNLLNVLYQGHAVWKVVHEHPEYAPLQRAYSSEVCTNSSRTALAQKLSEQMRNKKRELQDQIAQNAVAKINALPNTVIAKISGLIDKGEEKFGAKYRYPEFDDLLQQALGPEEETMATETGESVASMNARSDASALPRVLAALQDGATIYRPTGMTRYFTQCKDDRDRNEGIGLFATTIKRLEKDGTLVRVGVDRYGLGTLPAPTAPPVQDLPPQMSLF